MCYGFRTVEDLTDECHLLGVAGGGEGLHGEHDGPLERPGGLAHEQHVVIGQIKVAAHPDHGELEAP